MTHTLTQATAPPAPVPLRVEGPVVLAPGSLRPLLRRLLLAQGTEFLPDPRRGWRAVRTRAELFRDLPGGEVEFPVGLLPFVRQALAAEGVTTSVSGWRAWPEALRQPDLGFARSLRPAERRLLEAIDLARSGGLIRTGGRVTPARAVTLLCRYFPEARVAVAAPTRREARRLRSILKKSLARGRPVTAPEQVDWLSPVRVVVGCLGLIDHCRAVDWDAVILIDGMAAANPGRAIPLGEEGGAVFALLGPGQPRLAGDLMRLMARCGPPLHDCAREAGPRPSVVRLTPPWQPDPGLPRGAQRSRALYWANGPRNELVARLAGALAGEDRRELGRLGVEPSEGPCGPVAVLAECAEHARALAHLLRGWPVVMTHGANASQPPRPPEGAGVIITALAARAMKRLPYGVLVLASGEAFPELAWPAGQAEHSPVLIDFLDDTDEEARSAAAGRLGVYRSRGYRLPGPDVCRR